MLRQAFRIPCDEMSERILAIASLVGADRAAIARKLGDRDAAALASALDETSAYLARELSRATLGVNADASMEAAQRAPRSLGIVSRMEAVFRQGMRNFLARMVSDG